MVLNGGPGFALQRGKIVARDDAGHRHELVAARTKEVVVMMADQLKAGAPVFQLELADDAVRGELFGGAKDRRKIGYLAPAGQVHLQLFQRPGMALALAHKAYHRGGYACFSGHR